MRYPRHTRLGRRLALPGRAERGPPEQNDTPGYFGRARLRRASAQSTCRSGPARGSREAGPRRIRKRAALPNRMARPGFWEGPTPSGLSPIDVPLWPRPRFPRSGAETNLKACGPPNRNDHARQTRLGRSLALPSGRALRVRHGRMAALRAAHPPNPIPASMFTDHPF